MKLTCCAACGRTWPDAGAGATGACCCGCMRALPVLASASLVRASSSSSAEPLLEVQHAPGEFRVLGRHARTAVHEERSRVRPAPKTAITTQTKARIARVSGEIAHDEPPEDEAPSAGPRAFFAFRLDLGLAGSSLCKGASPSKQRLEAFRRLHTLCS